MPDDTAAIELRPWSPDDLELMTALLGDPAMTDHLGGPESPEQLRRRLDRYLAMTPADGRMFVITIGPAREPAGSVGYWPHESGSLETGWSVLPAFQGRGIATRGTDQCIDLAAAEGGFETVHAYPSVDNHASNALCRRLGFELRGRDTFEYPKGHWMTCNDWSLDLVARARATARYEIGGSRVALGPVRRELYPLHVTWLNDPEVAWNVFGAPVQRSFEEERAWIDQYRADPMTRLWLMYRLDEARPVGLAALTEIDVVPGTATFRTLIGDARDRGHGFGGESSELVLRHAFADLGLREIRLDVFGYNAAAIHLYERLGFREVERKPMQHEREGRRWDVIRMTLSRPEIGAWPTRGVEPSAT
jgi:RimJ/RimL family protein N-acetyltransferase